MFLKRDFRKILPLLLILLSTVPTTVNANGSLISRAISKLVRYEKPPQFAPQGLEFAESSPSWLRILGNPDLKAGRDYYLVISAIRNPEYFTQGFNLQVGARKPYLYGSLISNENNKTIWGSSGLILKAGSENIVYATAQDTGRGSREMLRNARSLGHQELDKVYDRLNRQIGILDPGTLIRNTVRSNSPYRGYNELLLRGTSRDSKSHVEIAGFYYFKNRYGKPIALSSKDKEQLELMFELARKENIPIVALDPTFRALPSKLYNQVHNVLRKSGANPLRTFVGQP